MSGLVAVVDLGKTNSKLALVDTANAQEIQVLTQPNTIRTDDRYPCIDRQAIESFIVDALHDSCQSFDIDALTVTTHGATAALINKQAELALPVMDYEFAGVEALSADYDAIRSPFEQTGSPRLPVGLNLGAQLYWQQHQFAQEFATVQSILTWPQYWVHRFSGALHNDVSSLGCHTDLYAPRQKDYSTLVTHAGWQALMPQTQTSGQLCGSVKSSWLKRIRRKKELPVYTGIHDSNASLVPYLMAQAAPFSVVSTGTWFISMAVGGRHVALDESRDILFNVNAQGDPVASARFMGGRERELLAVSGHDRHAAIDRLLTDNELLDSMLLPSVVPGTGPYPDSQARWINEPTDPGMRDTLVALYLAMMTARCLQLIGADGPTFIEGPLAEDTLFASMLKVVTDRPVSISTNQTGTSVGAAMLVNTGSAIPAYKSAETGRALSNFLHTYSRRWLEQTGDVIY